MTFKGFFFDLLCAGFTEIVLIVLIPGLLECGLDPLGGVQTGDHPVGGVAVAVGPFTAGPMVSDHVLKKELDLDPVHVQAGHPAASPDQHLRVPRRGGPPVQPMAKEGGGLQRKR